jgi:hypothetical protein
VAVSQSNNTDFVAVAVTCSELRFHSKLQFLRKIDNVGGTPSQSQRCAGKKFESGSEVKCPSHILKFLIVRKMAREMNVRDFVGSVT